MNKFLICGVATLLSLSFSACHYDDLDYDNVTPPEVPAAPATVSGIVSDMQGDPVRGATVSLGGRTATTGGDGSYSFSDVASGRHTVTVTAPGMVGVTGEVTVDDTSVYRNIVWNATLARVNTTEINVTVDGGGRGDVLSEALRGNDEGRVEIGVSVPAGSVPENTRIMITPIYTEQSAAVSRAGQEAMLIGATMSCSDPDLRLDKDVDITFELDGSVAAHVTTKKYTGGRWVEVPGSVVDGNVVISDREFTSYGLFMRVDVTERVTTEALVFARQEWNNLYGSSNEYVGDASFTYKAGMRITSKASNKLEGLLIEHLSRLFGSRMAELDGTYPVNADLPIGTALSISGAQEVRAVTVTGESRSVSGTTYGGTSVRVTTYNRHHNGGGSMIPGA